jgi:hypothetical protein
MIWFSVSQLGRIFYSNNKLRALTQGRTLFFQYNLIERSVYLQLFHAMLEYFTPGIDKPPSYLVYSTHEYD